MTLNKKKNKRGTINDSGFGKLISTIMVSEPAEVIKALQVEKTLLVGEYWRTVVHAICKRGDSQILQEIIKYTTNINYPDAEGRTILHDVMNGCYNYASCTLVLNHKDIQLHVIIFFKKFYSNFFMHFQKI